MKSLIKGTSYTMAFIFLFFIKQSESASIGDPIEPIGRNKFAIAGEQNLVFSREIEYGTFRQADIKDAYQWYGKGTYGVYDFINIYAKAGVSDLEHKFKDPSGDFDIEYDLGPLWGGGILASTPRWYNFGIGLDLQYAGWYVDVESLKYEQERSSEEIGEVLVTELQGTLFISHKMLLRGTASFIPYVGVCYLYLNNKTKETITYNTSLKNGTIDFDLDNSQDWHLIIGGDFNAGEDVSLTLEGSVLYDNRGVMCALSYKF